MTKTKDKREKLIEAADQLFHRVGYERSSIANLAKEAGVPSGNVYYYFKTKEEMAEAVTELRNRQMRILLESFEAAKTPIEKLGKFIDRFDELSESRARYGCPVGGLCQETNKFGGSLAEVTSTPFKLMLEWCQKQFEVIGQSAKHARENAVHILAGIQGAILLSHTFGDSRYLKTEIVLLHSWLHEFSFKR